MKVDNLTRKNSAITKQAPEDWKLIAPKVGSVQLACLRIFQVTAQGMICLIPKYFLPHAHIDSSDTETDPDKPRSTTREFQDSVEIEINSLMAHIGKR